MVGESREENNLPPGFGLLKYKTQRLPHGQRDSFQFFLKQCSTWLTIFEIQLVKILAKFKTSPK